jgi:putative autoinducer-2 (AI-2) aldolase
MDWGMKNRLSKIIHPQDGRCLMLAVDHGYFLGPTERLENATKTIAPLLPYADSLMLTRGILRNCVPPERDIPIVLRVSGGTSIIGEDLSKETITTSIEEAIKLNVSCLALSIFVGSKYEHQTLASLGKLVDEGEKYGIPVLAVTAVGKEMGRDARYLSLACRVAAELGAHVVKTYYCDNFEKVVESCPVPLVVAGGKKLPETDALKLAYDSVSHGAAGVDMGRNIWQSDYPVAMIKAVKAVVHSKSDFKEAYEIFLREREKTKIREPQKVTKTIAGSSVDFD